MKKTKRIIMMALSCLLISGCDVSVELQEEEETEVEVEEDSDTSYSSEYFSDRDFETDYDLEECFLVTLSDDSSSGDEVSIDGNIVTISMEGTYYISGTLSDGQLVVDASSEDKVQIILDNASITNSSGPCIYVMEADKVFITTVTDSVNTMSAVIEASSDSEVNIDAAIYSQDDLTLNGYGTITIESSNGNGITSKDTLYITSGTYIVDADNHGLEGKDALLVADGTFDIVAGGGSANAPTVTTSSNIQMPSGRTTTSTSEDITAKGLKSDSLIYIVDGDFVIDAFDDGIHSDLDTTILGGTIELSSGNDGIHSEVNTLIEGGEITLVTCYEGLEGETVIVNDGTIYMSCSDDGINAVSSSYGTGNASIEINGGSIYITAVNEGDGLDSNGDIYITGGYTVIESTDITTDTALDYDGEGTITGGVFIGLGSEGLTTQNFDEDSTQGSILLTFNSTLCEDITVYDSDGNVLIEVSPTKDYQVIVISSPDLVVGDTYTLQFGTFTAEVELDDYIYGEGNHSSSSGGSMSFSGGWR